ncbi:hypothetical protein Y032_0331g2725 [Ancylostoma ceylanicum]|uniref:Uncharacterized protein n=1 Tax=Ancylostoma ceylanicum TaxID=53326 RepID=A0A016RZA1_9BILA|nr:hypothetical protein Y032_0331g2725 [Ancylostoma ceylanicum]
MKEGRNQATLIGTFRPLLTPTYSNLYGAKHKSTIYYLIDVVRVQSWIREMNFNPSGGTCLLGNKILNDNLLDCWRECLRLSDFSRQREEVDEFNKYVENP